ncbi:amidohydrolase family protein [Microbulbifer litoralis]|uniref:amidohydrolase family protein n=1 Tax=Microbulbifer litoralis TaxID=2933965 RepID=UPI002027FA66
MLQQLIIRCLQGLLLSGIAWAGTGLAEERFYTAGDFDRVQKIDSHVHANSLSADLVDMARKANFKLISINVDYPDFPPVERQLEIAARLYQRHPRDFAFAGTFTMEGWGDQQWAEKKIAEIEHAVDEGAIAIKVWKNIGMDFRDQSGELVMVDDGAFTPIFNHLNERGLPLIGHQGEPRNCWLPISEMTVLNDKQYFKEHPQYHMYLHPELPSYEDQMESRDRMLDRHPELTFVGAHMASLEWSVDELARFLDDNPKAVVDMAARIGQIQYQSMHDYARVRDFFIKYQNRILYATDLTYSDGQSVGEFFQQALEVWQSDWRYLATDQPMTSGFVEGSFKGLKLPKAVIDKIYKVNSERIFGKVLYKK